MVRLEKPARLNKVCIIMRLLSILPLLLALTILTGCNTFERRAEKKADAFAALSPETKARLKNREIRVGDSFDLVYIALGAPDEKQQTTTASKETITWIYNHYWQEYRGETMDGVRRVAVRDKLTGTYSYYYEPVSRPVYADRKQAYLRIVFAEGKASMVEQARP